jgi:nucleotide-binding universal stress UspA family protein
VKRIIIPTDFSHFSKSAIKYASQLFKSEEVVYYLVHAFGVPHGAAMAVKNLDAILREEAEAAFEKFLPEITPLIGGNHSIKIRIINSSLIDAVRDVEKKEGANLIVMGTAGATGLKEIFFGSNASDTAANTKAPLITVPVDTEFNGLNNVVVATDNKPFKVFDNFEVVKQVLKENNAEITTLYVNAPNSALTPQGNVCSDVFKGIRCKALTIDAPSAASGIRNYAHENNPDLVILIARKHSFWERLFKRSVTERIVESLQKPILIMHE